MKPSVEFDPRCPNIWIVSVHPQFIDSYLKFGPLKRITDSRSVKVHAVDLRHYAIDKHGSVDAQPYGGGEGMVLRPEPLAECVKSIKSISQSEVQVVNFAPGAKPFRAQDAKQYTRLVSTQSCDLILICGRFSGIDQRFLDRYVDAEWSTGPYVLSGGELPALTFLDAVIRHIPNALGHAESARCDSLEETYAFKREYPLYTRPPSFEEAKVPEVLISGDHVAIQKWRDKHLRKVESE